MRKAARSAAMGLFLLLPAGEAASQQPVTSGAEPLKASVAPNPARFGTEEAFIAFAPFFQFEAGRIWSDPDELTDAIDNTAGQMRRARLYADFGYYDLGGRVAIDFATKPSPDIIYAYLDYNFTKSTTLQVGQQDQQFSQQTLIGSRSALFNESGVNATLQPASAVGAAIFHGQTNYSIGGGVYGTDLNRDDPLGESVTVAARGTFAPVNDGETAIHLGLSLAGTFDSKVPRSFSGSNGTNVISVAPISTGAYEDLDSYLATNVEFAATAGRFTLQSEYTLGEVRDGTRGDAFLYGGYLGLLAFLTDDHRDYDGKYGIFRRVKPKRPVKEGSGDFGAVEIGGRLDYLDLSDANDAASDKSGIQVAGTGMLNWYLTDKVRLSASDTYTAVIDGPADGDDYNTALLRFWFVY